jgi:hypothetical protein
MGIIILTTNVALKGLCIPARSNAPGIKTWHIYCPERAQQLLSPFRAHWEPILYLRALPGVVLFLPYRQYLIIRDLCSPLNYKSN